MDAKLIQELVDVGTGKIEHLFGGGCPDSIEGFSIRDIGCPACKVLIAGEKAANELRRAQVDQSGGDGNGQV